MAETNITTGTPNPKGESRPKFEKLPVVPIAEPIKLDEATQQFVSNYFGQQIEEATSNRAEMEREWIEWDRQWEAQPREKVKLFPWKNASNLELPVAAIVGMTVYSRLLNTIFAQTPFYSLTTENADLVGPIRELSDYLEWAKENELKVFDNLSPFLMNTVRMGTGHLKIPYVKDIKKIWTYDRTGKPVQKDVVCHDGPALQAVAINNMLVPRFDIEGIQAQPWIAERHRMTFGEIKHYEALKWFKDVDRMETAFATQQTREIERDRLEGVRELMYKQPYDVWEIWARFDINNDSREEEILLFFEPLTRSILGCYYNYYFDYQRPYVKAVYERREGRYYGIGIGRMCSQMQDGISTIHNQRIDNATIANARVWKTRRGSQIQDGDIWPGKVFKLGDPANDLIPAEMGEVYPSALTNETTLRDYVERRSAVSEFAMGRESSIMGSKATATSTLAIIQEGNKRFDLALKEVRTALGEAGSMIISRYHQYRPDARMYQVLGARAEDATRLFSFPPDFVTNAIKVQISAATAATNREIEKQNRITLFSLMREFFQDVFQLAEVIANPQLPPAMKELAVAAGKTAEQLARQILHDFDIKDPDNFVPSVERILAGAAAEEMRRTADAAAAATAAQGLGQPPGAATGGVPGANGAADMAGMVGAGGGGAAY